MREEEECEPGCYRHIYFLHDRYEKMTTTHTYYMNATEKKKWRMIESDRSSRDF